MTAADARDRPLGVVLPVQGGRGIELYDGGEEHAALALRIEPDGDLVLRNSSDARAYEIKKRDYGFKIIDATGALRAKLRVRSGKSSLRNASGDTYLWTRDPIPAAAVAVLALDDVRFAYASALSLAIVHWGLPGKPDAAKP